MSRRRLISLSALILAASTFCFAANPTENNVQSAAAKTQVRGEKLIALTFDDGPRPYVLFGTKTPQQTTGLLEVLDRENVKATFFLMGWRLTPKTWGEGRYETNIGVTCIDAAKEVLRRGHELENHTYSHAELRTAERKKGEAWVVNDVDKGAAIIRTATNSEARYLRPPDWILPDDARDDIRKKGITVLTIDPRVPVALRDVNSVDYLCAGAHPTQCPKEGLVASTVRQIEAREKHGVTTHILAFHELTSTTAVMPEFIKTMKARGYRFVTVREYMSIVGAGQQSAALR